MENASSIPSGTHILANFYGCDFSWIRELGMDGVGELIGSLVKKHGLTEVARKFHSFGEDAFTGVNVLAESHVAIHTWPEISFVTADLYVCNVSRDNSASAEALFRDIEAFLKPLETKVQSIAR